MVLISSGCKPNFGLFFLMRTDVESCMKSYSEGVMGWGGDWGYRPYVPVAQRRAKALREVRRLAGKGKQVSPVEIAGRAIVSTFWGKAWCDNLESYSDFSNRLPRGRTYVRNGSVVDLQIEPGKVTSLVSGSSLYRIAIGIRPLAASRWKMLKQQCGAQIGSIVELLQGRLSTHVMAMVTSRDNGLFPAPAEIEMSCSCPDWAGMCKHVAATLYGVGNRLDRNPELLFKLRQVDHLELISQAGSAAARPKKAGRKTIARDQLAEVFGIELEKDTATAHSAPAQNVSATHKSVPVTDEREKEDRADAVKMGRKASPDSGRSAGSKRKTLTAAARKRIAKAQKERWEALRQKLLANDGNGARPSSMSAGKSAQGQPVQSIRGRAPGRSRDALTRTESGSHR
jgi:uncharacterized Zn finger protein